MWAWISNLAPWYKGEKMLALVTIKVAHPWSRQLLLNSLPVDQKLHLNDYQFLLYMSDWSAFMTCAHLKLLQALALVPSWARLVIFPSIVLFLASACDFQHWLVFASFSIHAVFHSSICFKVNSKSSKWLSFCFFHSLVLFLVGMKNSVQELCF